MRKINTDLLGCLRRPNTESRKEEKIGEPTVYFEKNKNKVTIITHTD